MQTKAKQLSQFYNGNSDQVYFILHLSYTSNQLSRYANDGMLPIPSTSLEKYLRIKIINGIHISPNTCKSAKQRKYCCTQIFSKQINKINYNTPAQCSGPTKAGLYYCSSVWDPNTVTLIRPLVLNSAPNVGPSTQSSPYRWNDHLIPSLTTQNTPLCR